MRHIRLYSLISLASLAVLGIMAAGVGFAMNRENAEPVKTASTPTVSEPPEPLPEQQKQEKPEKEDKEQEKPKEKKQEEPKKGKREKPEAAPEPREPAEDPGPSFPASASPSSLNLNVPSIGIHNDPVTNSISESVLSRGAGKMPSTGFPWQQGANTYIAAHVYGYPSTGSWQQFAELPSMSRGDEIFLTDSGGITYEYRVSEVLTVAPTDVWVAKSTGENVVSLQTCVGPGWSERLVVRGELVGSSGD